MIYKSGKKHLDADALSRAPRAESNSSVCAILEPQSLSDLRTMQLTDPFIAQILNCLEDPNNCSRRQVAKYTRLYCLKNGLLYRRSSSLKHDSLRFVVPETLYTTFLEFEHDDSGHLGYFKTLSRMNSKYYWPNMTQSVLKYTQSCETCQKYKGPDHPAIGQLQPIEPPKTPFNLVVWTFLDSSL